MRNQHKKSKQKYLELRGAIRKAKVDLRQLEKFFKNLEIEIKNIKKDYGVVTVIFSCREADYQETFSHKYKSDRAKNIRIKYLN